MVEEFTKEQKEKLKTWAEQRDEILLDISNLKNERLNLQKSNKEIAESSTDIENKMNEIRGRIEELKIKESELSTLIPRDIANLKIEKSSLESEISILGKLIEALKPQKVSLESDIEKALATFEAIKKESLLLNKIVDNVTVVSKNNTDKINLLVNNLAASLEEIIAVNKKNVFETNLVIDKVPKMIMEAQKHGLIKNKI